MRTLRILALGSDQDWRIRHRRGEQSQIIQIDLGAGRRTEQDHREGFALPRQPDQIDRHGDIGHAPAPRLHGEGQFQTIATQPALIDNGQMTATGIYGRSHGAPQKAADRLPIPAVVIETIQLDPPTYENDGLQNERWSLLPA